LFSGRVYNFGQDEYCHCAWKTLLNAENVTVNLFLLAMLGCPMLKAEGRGFADGIIADEGAGLRRARIFRSR